MMVRRLTLRWILIDENCLRMIDDLVCLIMINTTDVS